MVSSFRISHREMTSDTFIETKAAENPQSSCEEGFAVLPATSEIVDQFSKLLRRISESALDHSITPEEAQNIRSSWDRLKCYAEGFVRCCEEGDFETIEKAENGGN